MGLFDWMTGSKAAPAGVAKVSAENLRAALLALNTDTLPFVIRDGGKEKVDLVAEWKILDARWYEIFAKASLTKVFKVLMKIDATKGEVRSVDQEWTVEWRAGVPNLSLAVSGFRGQEMKSSYDVSFGVKEDGSFGKIYEAKFNTAEIKTPLQAAVLANGWGWKGVAFGKL